MRVEPSRMGSASLRKRPQGAASLLPPCEDTPRNFAPRTGPSPDHVDDLVTTLLSNFRTPEL